MSWQDRDRSQADWRTYLVSTGSIIAVAAAAFWLLRDFRPPLPDVALAEGSLIVNINDATKEQLETVPGIGPSIAAEIIAGRPYENVDDLLWVSGIGKRALESMRPFLKADGETEPR